MIVWLFAIFDVKSDGFSTPFFAANDDVAVRLFARSVKDEASMMFSNPEDFSLHRLGSFNHETGKMVTHDPVYLRDGKGRDLAALKAVKEVKENG